MKKYKMYLDGIIENHKTADSHTIEWQGLDIICSPGVFSPRFGKSSFTLADALSSMSMDGWHVLDAGCGTGLQSIACVTAGALKVTSYDASLAAVECARSNVDRLGMSEKVEVFHAKAISELPLTNKLDLIVCNPPFFSSNVAEPEEEWERAFIDSDRSFLLDVLKTGYARLRSGGLIMLITGGELTPDTLKDLLLQEGFSLIAQKPYNDIGELSYCLTTAVATES
jgi:methylase of polypeptide subunit release factors